MQSDSEGPSVLPVIMAGGSGTRLWPASTETLPKPFVSFGPRLTLYQETLSRTALSGPVKFGAPYVVANARHLSCVVDQAVDPLPSPGLIVLEPFARGTAAVAVVAAELARVRDPGALVLLTPADHMITNPAAFAAVIAAVAPAAHDHIVTFGIPPSSASTGYGYIEQGDELGAGVHEIRGFFEKPHRSLAESYVSAGRHVWNAGVFLFRPDVLLDEFASLRPDILHAAKKALAEAEHAGHEIRLDSAAFDACPTDSLDKAIMEGTRRGAVIVADIGWTDIGAWSEMWGLAARSQTDNVVEGPAVVVDCEGTMVWSEGTPIAVVGVTDLVVAAGPEGVIVIPRSRAQEVGSIVAKLRRL